MGESVKEFLRQGLILAAALLPWLRVWDGTFALYFFVLVLAFWPGLIFAFFSAALLLIVLPLSATAAIFTGRLRRTHRALRWTTVTGLGLSLLYHLGAGAVMVFATLADLDDIIPEGWWVRMAGLIAGTLISGAATWTAARPSRA